MQPSAAAVIAAICVAAVLQPAAGHCISLGPSARYPNLQYPHVCPAERGWKALPALWAPVEVVLNCTSSAYTVVTTAAHQWTSPEALFAPVKWCGFRQLVSEPAVCRFALSPLQDKFLAVQAADSGGIFGKGGPADLSCEVSSSRELSLRHVALTAAGVLLFFNAPGLSMSPTFRLTSGSLAFMSGGLVVLSIILMRSMPYKRAVMGFFTVSSTTMLAAVRWLYGTWLPDMHSLLLSRPFLGYVIATGLLGLAVTYWMDDTSNVKLNNTIRWALRLMGLALVYLGVADEGVGLALMGLMFGSGVLAAVGRGLVKVIWQLVKHAALLLLWLLRSTWRLVSRSSRCAASMAAAAPAAVARAAGRRRAESLDEAAGSPLPDDDADHAAEPLLSDEEDEQRTASKRRLQQRRRARQAAAQQQYEEDEQQQQQQAPALDHVGSFREWAGSSPAAGGGSPYRLKQGPPLSPNVLAVQPDLQQHRWRQQEVAMRQQAAAAPAAAAAGETGGYHFPSSSRPAQASPWSQGKLVMDVTNRQAVSPPPAPQLSPAVPAASPAAGQASLSPLVQQGKILNPLTNKAIQFNKPTYNMLLSEGYTPDLVNGVMLAPADGPAAAAAQQASAGGGSSGRAAAVTPGSQVRQRAGRPRSAAVATPQ